MAKPPDRYVQLVPASALDQTSRVRPSERIAFVDDAHNPTDVGGPGSGDNDKAKVSANDTTAGYLNGKLVAGDNVELNEQSDGGNETLEVKATSAWRRHFLVMGG